MSGYKSNQNCSTCLSQIVLECLRSPAGASVLSKHIAMLRMNRRPASVTSRPAGLAFHQAVGFKRRERGEFLGKMLLEVDAELLRHRGVSRARGRTSRA